jgi:hypothetical protein
VFSQHRLVVIPSFLIRSYTHPHHEHSDRISIEININFRIICAESSHIWPSEVSNVFSKPAYITHVIVLDIFTTSTHKRCTALSREFSPAEITKIFSI